jgi:hypothetical protein
LFIVRRTGAPCLFLGAFFLNHSRWRTRLGISHACIRRPTFRDLHFLKEKYTHLSARFDLILFFCSGCATPPLSLEDSIQLGRLTCFYFPPHLELTSSVYTLYYIDTYNHYCLLLRYFDQIIVGVVESNTKSCRFPAPVYIHV